jgi:hypothetical protein
LAEILAGYVLVKVGIVERVLIKWKNTSFPEEGDL